MSQLIRLCWLVTTCVVTLAAADYSWRSKPPSDWNEQELRQVLTASPWAKTVTVKVGDLPTEDQRREGGEMGLPHGVGYDGLEDNRPRPQLPAGIGDIVKPDKRAVAPQQSVVLQLRWESALPIRVAELKSRMTDVPLAATDSYQLTVYGVPQGNYKGDPQRLGEPLKREAILRRPGKKDVRPSAVQVIQQDTRLIIIYSFPLTAEISSHDGHVEVEAHIGRLSFDQSFDLAEMEFQGKLEI